MYSILLCVLIGLVHAAIITSPTIHPGIKISGASEVPIEWDVQAFPDGPTLTLVGTVQEVHAQLLKINPNYTSDFHLDNLESRNPDDAAEFSASSVACDKFLWGFSSYDTVSKNIDHLRPLQGRPRNKAGPSACGRVSCSYNSAIWWCNFSNEPKTLDSWTSIVRGAEEIQRVCKVPGFGSPSVQGGVAGHGDWAVVVGYDSLLKC
ncbi:Uncharacterized protein TCAP_02562 [Tolypocladium capitatum]|uniref:Secreted protein n=1 Tax=Tolypocladium capitatum TaxID=45235 RepID=A0A2K3QIY9_9HYPO|nr:Uncharacterized protein TCAP_02562 [Tolypocladium capitatum]